ncbi:hypothetical protein NQD34_000128 [Periophthalmus magnuspinnatus]|nr:hypothetical protein NQD34_000128 [Periophthalmus magnuspinnatus]
MSIFSAPAQKQNVSDTLGESCLGSTYVQLCPAERKVQGQCLPSQKHCVSSQFKKIILTTSPGGRRIRQNYYKVVVLLVGVELSSEKSNYIKQRLLFCITKTVACSDS